MEAGAEARLVNHLYKCAECSKRLDSLSDADDPLFSTLRQAIAPKTEPETVIDAHLETIARTIYVEESGVNRSNRAATIPRSIGPYDVVDVLQRGGMGIIYKVRHRTLNRLFVLKTLPPDQADDPSAIARIGEEIRAFGELGDHPNIVRTAHAAEDERPPYLVMEFVDGLDLARLVARIPRLSVSNACEMCRQTALGLGYLHAHGRVHRDVKPSNIVLGSAGIVKVIDFGIMQRVDHSPTPIGVSTDAVGTVDYMAPEQMTGEHDIDLRSDLYSLGCTLFHLLTGRPPMCPFPYFRLNADYSSAKVVAELADKRPDTPKELLSLIGKLLAKNRADRPANAAVVMRELTQFAAGADLAELLLDARRVGSTVGHPTLPTSPIPTPTVAVPRRRRRFVWLFWLAGILTALTALTWAALGRFWK